MGFTGKSDEFLNRTITNIDFYPDLSLGVFQEVYRIPTSYTEDLVVSKISLSIAEINHSLSQKKIDWEAESFNALDETTSVEIGGINEAVLFYERAVYCKAKALCLMEYKSIAVRDVSAHIARDDDEHHATWIEESNAALRALLGEPPSRIYASLI